MEIDTVKEWFGEKTEQVDSDAIVAFGIPIESRYSKEIEVSEMLKFASTVAKARIAHYVTRVFYDTKCGVCTIVPDVSVKVGDFVYETILNAAQQTISGIIEVEFARRFRLTFLDKVLPDDTAPCLSSTTT